MTFSYYTKFAGIVTLKIYDQNGDLVKVAADGDAVTAGILYRAEWDGRNGVGAEVLSGVYYAELQLRRQDGTIEQPDTLPFTVLR